MVVTDEKMLEELYELLTLYFEISPHGGLVKSFEAPHKIESALDHVILREILLAEITRVIIGGDELCLEKLKQNSKAE